MDALKAGLDGTPVVLIQGPPGTGKTRTILNLLSVVMHSAHKGALELHSSTVGHEDKLSPADKNRWGAHACMHAWSRGGAGHAWRRERERSSDESARLNAARLRPPFLRSSRRLWLKQAPWLTGDRNPRDLITPEACEGRKAGADQFGLLRSIAPTRVGRQSGPRAHVLVCAPSNSALDEIVIRILKTGLMDKDGNMYAPR